MLITKKISAKVACTTVLAIVAANILFEFGAYSSSQAQVTNSTTAQPSKQEITPEQKAKMCSPGSPNLKFVNTTESQICGVPPSQKTTPAASPTSPANATRVLPTPTTTP
jgi:hypothetical protein